MVLIYFPCLSRALVLGCQHCFSFMSLSMINALSLDVLLFETNLELGHMGNREELSRQYQKFTFCNSL